MALKVTFGPVPGDFEVNQPRNVIWLLTVESTALAISQADFIFSINGGGDVTASTQAAGPIQTFDALYSGPGSTFAYYNANGAGANTGLRIGIQKTVNFNPADFARARFTIAAGAVIIGGVVGHFTIGNAVIGGATAAVGKLAARLFAKFFPGQRVDPPDLQFVARDSQLALLQQTAMAQFNQFGGRIISGFAMSMVGTVLTIQGGRAVLGLRKDGAAQEGVLVLDDEAQSFDTVGRVGVDTVWITASLVVQDFKGRVFWDDLPAPPTEYTRGVPTREGLRWVFRLSPNAPGPEWTRIGTLDNAGPTLTDLRDFLLDAPQANFGSGDWGTTLDRTTPGQDVRGFARAVIRQLQDIIGVDASIAAIPWKARIPRSLKALNDHKLELDGSLPMTGGLVTPNVAHQDGTSTWNTSENLLLLLNDQIAAARSRIWARAGAVGAGEAALEIISGGAPDGSKSLRLMGTPVRLGVNCDGQNGIAYADWTVTIGANSIAAGAAVGLNVALTGVSGPSVTALDFIIGIYSSATGGPWFADGLVVSNPVWISAANQMGIVVRNVTAGALPGGDRTIGGKVAVLRHA